jgi:hypothetical protein
LKSNNARELGLTLCSMLAIWITDRALLKLFINDKRVIFEKYNTNDLYYSKRFIDTEQCCEGIGFRVDILKFYAYAIISEIVVDQWLKNKI